MLVTPRIKGFICTTAHPSGCQSRVEQDLATTGVIKGAPRRVLVIGASGGYGLACRIAAVGWGADTVGLSFEREATESKTGTAGHYNTIALERLAAARGLRAVSLNTDAFSDTAKSDTIAAVRDTMPGGQVDLVVYSLAAPRRADPVTGEIYSSVIKPVGEPFSGRSINVQTGALSDAVIEPAAEGETEATVKVMGGEDWQLWIEALLQAGALADGALTLAFSYLGPAMTHAIYKDGTIGRAKEHLDATRLTLDSLLAPLGGKAFVSVNKALVTQASSAIPVVPLYISLLYRVMKERGTHEDCQRQMNRLFARIYAAGSWDAIPTDTEGRIRMDDWEMADDIQQEVARRWETVSEETLSELGDIEGYRSDFLRIFGFGIEGVDYDAEVSPIL